MDDGKQMMLPYGVSDFVTLRKGHYAYVDKTKFIEKLEKDRYVTFLRPPGFGKSLFVSTLEAYYDVRYKNQFQDLLPTPTSARIPLIGTTRTAS